MEEQKIAEIHKIICPDVNSLTGIDCANCWLVCKTPCEIKTKAILALIAEEQKPLVEALEAGKKYINYLLLYHTTASSPTELPSGQPVIANIDTALSRKMTKTFKQQVEEIESYDSCNKELCAKYKPVYWGHQRRQYTCPRCRTDRILAAHNAELDRIAERMTLKENCGAKLGSNVEQLESDQAYIQAQKGS